MKKRDVLLLVGISVLLSGCFHTTETNLATTPSPDVQSTSENRKEETSQKPEKRTINKPDMSIDQNKTYSATLKTSAGDIVLSLNAKQTPITVNNFVYLANNNFYNDTIFHRVIKGFMIQGGDSEGTGMGGPGYQFDDEPFEGEYTRGAVAMANSGPNTNGSQFFIMHANYPLPKKYVIFGQVTSGIGVVDNIAQASVETNNSGESSKPVAPATIESVEISEQ